MSSGLPDDGDDDHTVSCPLSAGVLADPAESANGDDAARCLLLSVFSLVLDCRWPLATTRLPLPVSCQLGRRASEQDERDEEGSEYDDCAVERAVDSGASVL